MSIDWLTVAAQVANFLVLLWLLKRFLYRPILDGIDAREAEISERMAQASRLMEEARAETERYRRKLADLQARGAEITEASHREAMQERDRLLAEARRQIERERKEFESYLAAEKRKFTRQLTQSGARVLVQLARKALADLADESLETRIAAHAARKLEPMAAELRKLAEGHGTAIVTTHAPLPAEARDTLTADLQRLVPGLECRFETDPEQSFGLVLRVGSASVSWTIDSYLEELDAMMAETLQHGQTATVHAQ